MGKLFTFNEEHFPKIAEASLEAVQAVSLYYLHHGRNAWHSTWVSKYREGCMHSDEQSAKASAEEQRTQGSVFNISRIPAVLFVSSSGSIAVTEINSLRPLAGYSPDAVNTHSNPDIKLIEGARD
jgi:hypothetical protein